MSGLRDFFEDIDRRYPPNTDFGYIRYLNNEHIIRLTEDNQRLKYEKSELKYENERLKIEFQDKI